MNYLLIDGNSLLHAAQHSKPLSCNGIPTHGIIGFLKTLSTVVRANPLYPDVRVLWDHKAQWRFDIYPDYKGNRENTEEKIQAKTEVRLQRPYLAEALKHIGINQYVATGYEADDLAGLFVREALLAGKKVRLVTGDEDWLQLINSFVSWVDPRNKAVKKCDRSNFRSMTGYKNGRNFLIGKTLEGDSSDKITGVGGIGEKTAAALVDHFDGIKALFATYDANGDFGKDDLPPELSRARKKINDFCRTGRPIFIRNYKLMNLMTDSRDEHMALSTRVAAGTYNWELFEAICMDLNFNTIIHNRALWESTFGEAAHE